MEKSERHNKHEVVRLWILMIAILVAALMWVAFLVKTVGAQEGVYLDVNTLERRISANRAWAGRLESRLEGLRRAGFTEQGEGSPFQAIQKDLKDLDREHQELVGQLEARRHPAAAVPMIGSRFSGAAGPAMPPLWGGRDPFTFKGKDWLKLSEIEKEVCAFRILASIEEQGVPIRRPTGFYIAKMDETLTSRPYFQEKALKRVFLFAVYDNEPESRKAIDRLGGTENNS